MAELVSYALTSVADVKETLGISSGDSSKNNLITRKINQATDLIEAYCNLSYSHHFKQATYTDEEYDGTGVDQLSLKMRPVTSITSFSYRNTTENENSWDVIETTDYFLDQGAGVVDLLFSQGRHWNYYKLTYVGGYSTIPSALSEACATIAAYLTDNATSGAGVKIKQEGQRKIEYFAIDSSSGDSLIEQLNLDGALSRYKNYAIQSDK